MSFYGAWQTATIANGGTTSNAVALGRDYEYINVILPTLTAGTLKMQVCDTYGGTYQDLGSSAITASTTGAYSDTWTLGGWSFIKIVSSADQSGDKAIKVRGWRN